MNLEDIKMLRDLYQLLQEGIITGDDFTAKKDEIFRNQKPVSSDEKIKLLQELHQLAQEGIISHEEFNSKKKELLNSTATTTQTQKDQSSHTEDQQKETFARSSSGFAGPGIEKTLNELNIDGLNMKLTNEKLYVDSVASNETFALRSVNGIGIVDLIDKYNQDLDVWKEKTKIPWVSISLLVLFALFLLRGVYNWYDSEEINTVTLIFGKDGGLILGIILLGLSAYLYLKKKNILQPALKSVVRVMLSGGIRDFEFNKKSNLAPDVAKFVALVEDTLTAYHKNN